MANLKHLKIFNQGVDAWNKWRRENRPKLAELPDAKLRDRDLRRIDLLLADLNGAELVHAKLNSADLRGAELCFANLSGASLVDADLSGADLSNANMEGWMTVRRNC